jgi:hypothetical protein
MTMRSIYKNTLPVTLLLLVMALFACKKDNYLTDGGTHNAYTSMSTYDYLKGHSADYFDTVVLLIDHFNLKDTVNKAGAFFAFTDFSVNALMTALHCTSLQQLYDSVSSKLLTQYMFSDSSISLANAGLRAQQQTNWAGTAAPCAVEKKQYTYSVYLTNSSPTYTYYALVYVKVNGVLDGTPNTPPGDPADVELPCQTEGIKTSTGTTLHILANNAALNKL